jgi:hypothetical protein
LGGYDERALALEYRLRESELHAEIKELRWQLADREMAMLRQELWFLDEVMRLMSARGATVTVAARPALDAREYNRHAVDEDAEARRLEERRVQLAVWH